MFIHCRTRDIMEMFNIVSGEWEVGRGTIKFGTLKHCVNITRCGHFCRVVERWGATRWSY